jgi:hypothetical protein
MKASIEVADIFRTFGPAYRQQHGADLSMEQRRAMRAIEVCRTDVLGGHIDHCDQCNATRISYNSCRNRHCPKCQFLDKERWVEAQQQLVLPVPYFHLVFTLPSELRPLALRNQKIVYGLLFKAASQTLLELSRDPAYLGAQVGYTALLHTWSQTLAYHPHLHCIVTGGGLSRDGKKWIPAGPDFFLPVKVLSRLFRGKLLAFLRQAYAADELIFPGRIVAWQRPAAFKLLLARLYGKEWVVYCKPPMGDAHQALAYLGRYAHRVALSNDRLVRLDGDQVTFRYRDRADGNRVKHMTLAVFEFIRRFLCHVLPHQFIKIRHYGLLSTRNRRTKLAQAQHLLGQVPSAAEPGEKVPWDAILYRLTGTDPTRCPHCANGHMIPKQILLPLAQRAPPLLRA